MLALLQLSEKPEELCRLEKFLGSDIPWGQSSSPGNTEDSDTSRSTKNTQRDGEDTVNESACSACKYRSNKNTQRDGEDTVNESACSACRYRSSKGTQNIYLPCLLHVYSRVKTRNVHYRFQNIHFVLHSKPLIRAKWNFCCRPTML